MIQKSKFHTRYEYEKFYGNRHTDFTIEISGITILWEHAGVTDSQQYQDCHNKKVAEYENNGVRLITPEQRKDKKFILSEGEYLIVTSEISNTEPWDNQNDEAWLDMQEIFSIVNWISSQKSKRSQIQNKK